MDQAKTYTVKFPNTEHDRCYEHQVKKLFPLITDLESLLDENGQVEIDDAIIIREG